LSRLWYSRSVYSVLIEILQKKQGSVTDAELYKALKENYNDLSFFYFNKELMKLEIEGLIHVYNLTKNKRGVELIKG
jgi:Fe2+ or Zn2+ uptake regulation protein